MVYTVQTVGKRLMMMKMHMNVFTVVMHLSFHVQSYEFTVQFA